MVPGLEHKRLVSFDGTEIAYQVRGVGPAVVLANGLGGSFEAFRHIYDALGDAYRTICWDYRGLYGSAVPRDRRALTMADQVRDLEAILAAETVERAVFVGWSMGVQFNFEFFRGHADMVDGIVAINGTSGRPFETVLSSRAVKYVIPTLLRAARAQAELIGRATRTMVAWDGLITMAQRFGMVSRTLDLDAFRDVAAGFATLDWTVYSTLLERLGEHDASDVLPRVSVPTLVVTGDRDIITPAFTAERIHRAVAGSRFVLIEGGTHYTPVEYPHVIQEELLDFLGTIPGYVPAELGAGPVGAGATRA